MTIIHIKDISCKCNSYRLFNKHTLKGILDKAVTGVSQKACRGIIRLCQTTIIERFWNNN